MISEKRTIRLIAKNAGPTTVSGVIALRISGGIEEKPRGLAIHEN